jgi:hypothetical protein
MKYLAIFLLSFLVATPAYAAKEVKGEVPEVRPLQPPPVGVNPNINHSVQFSDPDHPLNPNVENSGTQGSEENLSQQIEDGSIAGVKNKKSYTFVWIVLILAAFGTGYWFLRKKS